MSNMIPDKDWYDNHELRIDSLEQWREKHDEYTMQKVTKYVEMELTLKTFKETITRLESSNHSQTEQLDDLKTSVNKIVISTLTTIVLILAKFAFDVLIKK